MFGCLDELFDFDGNGVLDAAEEATAYMVLEELFGEDEDKKKELTDED